MDNITHALAGMVLAEAALAYRPSHIKSRGVAHFVSIAASNLPDLDFVYIGITGGKLGYLLHHRGHTHTLLAAPVMSLLVLLLAYLGLRVLRRDTTQLRRPALWVLTFIGPLVHITMDYANNYGVHPFWPLDNHWYYGDGMFIIEPLLWAATIPGLIALARTRIARALLILVLAGGIALAWAVPLVSLSAAVLLTVLALSMFAVVWRAARPMQLLATGLAAAGVYGLMLTGSNKAGRLAQQATANLEGDIHDVVITPMPANPICYRVLIVYSSQKDYVIRRGYVSLLPAWHRPTECSQEERSGTAPFSRVPGPYGEQVALTSEFRQPLGELRELYADSCHAQAFFRFSRAPFRMLKDAKLVLGDVRYDREDDLGFAEVEIPEKEACPQWVPPWVPPRQQLLQSR